MALVVKVVGEAIHVAVDQLLIRGVQSQSCIGNVLFRKGSLQ